MPTKIRLSFTCVGDTVLLVVLASKILQNGGIVLLKPTNFKVHSSSNYIFLPIRTLAAWKGTGTGKMEIQFMYFSLFRVSKKPLKPVFRIRIRIVSSFHQASGSGFSQVSGS
jgi:hypothetical protein